jgi:hypothetical protein
MSEAEAKGKEIEEAFNELVTKCAENGGHIYIVDRKKNSFILRITEPIRISVYEGYKGEKENGGKQ